MLRARVTHAITNGIVAGVASFLESTGEHGAALRALILGAVVAGLSGGAGAAIRSRTAGGIDLEPADLSELLSRLSELEAQVHHLASLVNALLGEAQLRQQEGRK